MGRLFFFIGCLFCGFSVAMGAWGAHSQMFREVQLLWIEKGTRYEMLHGLALIIASLVMTSHKNGSFLAFLAGICFLVGTVLFSGSLYVMAVIPVDAGYITPIGGLLFIVGWLLLALTTPGKMK